MPVVNLDDYRQKPEEYDGLVCACGSAWFNVAATFSKDGVVTGHLLVAECVECGEATSV